MLTRSSSAAARRARPARATLRPRRLERRRRRPRALPARQGLRGLAHAWRLRAARPRSRRLPRRGTDAAGDHRVSDRRHRSARRALPLIETRYPHVVSYAIRRCEFDDFLLRRAGVRVLEGTPVDRAAARRRPAGLSTRPSKRRSSSAPAGTSVPSPGTCAAAPTRPPRSSPKKRSFALDASDATSRIGRARVVLLPRSRGLRLVRPQGRLPQRRHRPPAEPATSTAHVRDFIALLEQAGTAWRRRRSSAGAGMPISRPALGAAPLDRARALTRRRRAGLAYPESGEGIQPAIESGRLAARNAD